MKKALLVTAGLVCLAASASLAQTVNVSDSAVETAIREEIGKANGDLTESDLAKVKKLSFFELGLSKITFPDGLVNIEEIDLTRNVLSPSLFNPVRFPDDMENLKILKLNGNRLPNMSSIDHLTTLEVLDMSDNGLTEIDIPLSLVNLKELNLEFNELESLVFPEGFVNLEVLNLKANALKGSIFSGPVTFPTDLSSLREFNLSENELGTVNIPAGLLSLEILMLENNELGSINFGGPLPSAIEIIGFNNKIKKLTLPEGMANLEVLDLFNNNITELEIQDGLNTEPFIDLAGSPIERFIVPEGTHEDLINYFERFDAEIIFIPRPLPNVFASVLPDGQFEFLVAGPTGTYTVYKSVDLINWSEVGTVVNEIGEVGYTTSLSSDATAFFRIERVEEPAEEE